VTPLVLCALLSPEIEVLLEEWDVAAARQALASRPRDERTAYLEGLVLLYRGEYQAAVDSMDASGRVDREPDGAMHRRIAAAAAEITGAFVREPSPAGHFELRASPADKLLLPYAGEALEAARQALFSELGFVAPERIPVDIYPRPDDLARVSTLTADEIRNSGTIALCKWNRLMLVTPRALLRGYAWMDSLVHEYVHYVVSRLTRNRVPIWLHEGIARRLEARYRLGPGEREPLPPAQAHLLFSALKANALIPLARMHPSMAKLPTQRDTSLAFAQVQTLVEHLEERAGRSALRALLERIRDGEDAAVAVENVVREPMERFLSSWRRALAERARPTGPRPLELVFRDPDAKGDRVERDPTATKEGRHERLGGLLRARGRVRAAAIEYEKAIGATRSPGPFLLAKTAQTHLEAGAAAPALGRARTALRFYPELAGPNVTAGQAALALGDFAGARAFLLAALRTSPFDARVHCGLQQVHEQAGDPEASRERDLCRQLAR